MKNRVEIGCYTKMSQMKGINSCKEYIDEAIKRKWKAIGFTDLNSTQCFYDVENYIEQKNVKDLKIIYGIKTKFVDNKIKEISKNKIYDIVILVKEQVGLKNLYTILSKALINEDYNNQVVLKSELDKYRDGLLYGANAGVGGEIYQSIYQGEENIKEKIKYYDFLEVEPLYNAKEEIFLTNDTHTQIIDKTEEIKNINEKIIKLGKENDILVIATSNPLFIDKQDKICNEIIKYSQGIKNIKYDNERFLHTTEEMLDEFNYIEDKDTIYDIVVNNTNMLADRCENIKIKPNKSYFPKLENCNNIIKEKCYKKVNEIYGEKIPKNIKERLEIELNSIIDNNFEVPYLLVADIVKKSEELGYITINRGSVGCSLVAYLLGITDYNPIQYKLPYESFAKINYDKEPDIDINVSEEIRDLIFKDIKEKYGVDKVICCGTVGTIANSTAKKMVKKYLNDFEITVDNKKIEELTSKLCDIKKSSGVNPAGIFILPKEQDIIDFSPIEIESRTKELKTHIDYHNIWGNQDILYKYDIIAHDIPTLLHRLQKITGINPRDIDLKDKETLELFFHTGDERYFNTTKGISEFKTEFVINMLKQIHPKSFNDLVCISCLSHGTDTWVDNGENLIKEGIPVNELVSNREDIMNYLIEKGIDKKIAFEIMEFIQKGKARKARREFIQRKYNINEEITQSYWEKWKEYKEIMEKNNIPEWYIKSCEKISYLFPKSHAIAYTINAFRIAWYKIHYPKEFYKAYLELNSNIDIKTYNNKKQVEASLNNAKKTKAEMSGWDSNLDKKIEILEILLEMYERGIKKDKKISKDDYNLINSKAIENYCREIEYKFNTEELATLVYRNKKMDIKEKIAKYQDLIDNYPDMEVIERIHCYHYDSVKTMIRNEIARIKNIYEDFLKKDENCFYSWYEYNRTTKCFSRDAIERSRRTYKEVDKEIREYINKFDDTISYTIIKKILGKEEKTIYANYIVINKKPKLIEIYYSNRDFNDLDGIFVNIPTPFKKGDILISQSPSMRNYGDNEEIFVLEYLRNWDQDIKESLARGNYDLTDMTGRGYYLYDDNAQFVLDDKWDYDSFEYYDGKLEGRNRILKAISSFLKEDISFELFIHAYDVFKNEDRKRMPEFYTDKGLKLAGFSDLDISTINHHEKIYNMPEEEKMHYIRYLTDGLKGINEKDVKQIETDIKDNIFVLTKDGNLYENGEFIDREIEQIHMFDGNHLYKITSDKKIKPIIDEWDDTDKYLNNNNCKYKKIEISKMHIVLLSENGDVRALCGGYPNLGIIPDNFINVEDITILEDEKGIDMPYIYKNDKFIKLYVE